MFDYRIPTSAKCLSAVHINSEQCAKIHTRNYLALSLSSNPRLTLYLTWVVLENGVPLRSLFVGVPYYLGGVQRGP